MKIKLEATIYSYLVDNLLDTDKKMREKINVLEIDGYAYIELNDFDADEIRDLALGKLQIVGYDINYELTQDGKMLEEIIDLLYQ